MAIRLSVLLLLTIYVVMQFGGRDTDNGPFAEEPGADPSSVILAVAPLDEPVYGRTGVQLARRANAATPVTPLEEPKLAVAERVAATPTSAEAVEPAVLDAETAIDLAVIDVSDSGLAAPSRRVYAPGVSPHAAPPVVATASDVQNLAEVTGSAVNLRAGPSTTDAVLGRARLGDQVEWVSAPAPGWAMIRHPDVDRDVYMSSSYLRRIQ